MSLVDYIAISPGKHATYLPHTAGRYSVKRFRKAQCHIIERLTNSLMMHGRNNGKKLMAVCIIKHAMKIIHLITDLNPIQVIVDAGINSVKVNELIRHLMWKNGLINKYPPDGLASQQLKTVDGLHRLCKWVDCGLKRAAVTNAPRLNAELMISILGLSDFFQLLVVGSV